MCAATCSPRGKDEGRNAADPHVTASQGHLAGGALPDGGGVRSADVGHQTLARPVARSGRRDRSPAGHGPDAVAQLGRLPAALHRAERLHGRRPGDPGRRAVTGLRADQVQSCGRLHRVRCAGAAHRLRAVRWRHRRRRRPAPADPGDLDRIRGGQRAAAGAGAAAPRPALASLRLRRRAGRLLRGRLADPPGIAATTGRSGPHPRRQHLVSRRIHPRYRRRSAGRGRADQHQRVRRGLCCRRRRVRRRDLRDLPAAAAVARGRRPARRAVVGHGGPGVPAFAAGAPHGLPRRRQRDGIRHAARPLPGHGRRAVSRWPAGRRLPLCRSRGRRAACVAAQRVAAGRPPPGPGSAGRGRRLGCGDHRVRSSAGAVAGACPARSGRRGRRHQCGVPLVHPAARHAGCDAGPPVRSEHDRRGGWAAARRPGGWRGGGGVRSERGGRVRRARLHGRRPAARARRAGGRQVRRASQS
jgi:hypothetical protein